jgi:phage terminase large subunit-like protein
MKRGPRPQPALTRLPALRARTPGKRVAEFFRTHLVHVKGQWAGQPFELLPWQYHDIIGPLFGTVRPDGLRQYRTCYVEIPRRNSKSTLAAGIALYMLFADNEPGAQIVSAAADREQAAIVFDIARSMVEASPPLAGLAQIYRREIVIPSTGSRYKVISSEAYSKHGLDLHGAIVDELHAHETRDLLDVLQTSVGSRRQPLSFIITTAGFDRQSVCWQYHELATQIRAGLIPDPTFLPVLYGASLEDDWTDPAVWRHANPGLGVTLKDEYLVQECRRAQEMPAYENAFKRLHLNIWTESDTKWLDTAAWDACGGPVDATALEGRPCYAGLDLSNTADLSALVLLFPDLEGGYDVLTYCWVPGESIEARSRRDRVPYGAWVASGALTAAGHKSIDYEMLRATIQDCAQRYRLQRISYDRWNAAHLVELLRQDGAPMVEMGQGFASLSNPAKELERLVRERKLRHGGHPVLRWCIANTVAEQDAAGNLKPSKAKSTEKIDATVALIMALDGAMRTAGSVYDLRARAGERALTVV